MSIRAFDILLKVDGSLELKWDCQTHWQKQQGMMRRPKFTKGQITCVLRQHETSDVGGPSDSDRHGKES
ncbi:MAG: hypothetical protein DBO99_05955 [gamma proteobacterium symbiont of Ctena orbiculata]|nr:MAG: hypothetical protein DBO99_05955 [gamma proteobacterium symbiont of Ctena orbiculata]